MLRGSGYGWLLCPVLSLCLYVSGQTISLPQALAAARYPLQVHENGFSGAGASVLATAIDGADFVLLGEDHLTREIPRFARAVCDEMAPHGLTAMAFESSPAAATYVESTVGQPDYTERMAKLQRMYPESIAFLSDRDEADLAAHCAAAAPGRRIALWGLDQEFLGAAGWMVKRMMSTAPGPKSMAALRTMQRDEAQMAAEARRTGSLAGLYLLRASDAQLAAAKAAIQEDGAAETRAIFSELEMSRSLYLQHETDFRAANGRRATLLKRNFEEYLAKARQRVARPRVLLKLGDTHLYRGFNELHELNLGNFVAEQADVSGGHSLHILVLGVVGTHATYAGYGQGFAHRPYALRDDPDYQWLVPAITTRTGTGAAGPWTLFDLRQLRFGRVAGMDAAWERVVYGYDLLVLIPEITPATLLQ